jgi:hypothetical protein
MRPPTRIAGLEQKESREKAALPRLFDREASEQGAGLAPFAEFANSLTIADSRKNPVKVNAPHAMNRFGKRLRHIRF